MKPTLKTVFNTPCRHDKAGMVQLSLNADRRSLRFGSETLTGLSEEALALLQVAHELQDQLAARDIFRRAKAGEL